MKKTRVLFVCVHNSARSQMAEAFLNTLAGDRFEAMSAGLEPTSVNPLAVEVMKEAGIDISDNATTDVFELYRNDELFSYVITVCDAETAQKCPVFPGITERINWSFEDPSTYTGSHEEMLERIRKLRDAIKTKVLKFIDEHK
jgi:arsenate reductase